MYGRVELTVVGQIEEVSSVEELGLHVSFEPKRFGDFQLELDEAKRQTGQ